MSGLRKICKALGSITVVTDLGEKIVYRWIPSKDKPVRVHPRKKNR